MVIEVMASADVKPRKLPAVSLAGVKTEVVPLLSVSVMGVAWNASLMLVAQKLPPTAVTGAPVKVTVRVSPGRLVPMRLPLP